MTLTLEALNRMPPADFAAAVGDTFELAPWVAEGAASRRPFATVTALHEAMMGVVRAGTAVGQVGFVPYRTVTMGPDAFVALVRRAAERLPQMPPP